MSRLDLLPPELVLHVLAYLPFQSLYSLHLVSRYWQTFVIANESSIYHHAALLHRFVSSVEQPLPEAVATHVGQYMKEVDSWKAYCQRSFQLERNWAGQGSAVIKTYPSYFDIHRIKVDEALGLLITTHRDGGIRVRNLENDELLWELPWMYVREYAHCEYDQGFLIFDRLDNQKEVWRLVLDCDDAQASLKSQPDQAQIAAWQRAEERHEHTSQGHFQPWALLQMPEQTTAFRFVYPTLAVVALDAAYLWDVRSGELVHTVRDIQDPHGGNDSTLGIIRYVEVNASYIFLCGSSEFRVFDRQCGALVLRMSSKPTSPMKAVVLDLSAATQMARQYGQIVPLKASRVDVLMDFPMTFTGAHVSSSGRDIAIMLGDDRIVLVRDFERVIKSEISLHEASLEINTTIPTENSYIFGREKSVYLAFDSGRVGLVTTSGVFTFTLDAAFHGLLGPRSFSGQTSLGIIEDSTFISADTSFPYLVSSSIKGFLSHKLCDVSCLQMTRTKLFLTWDLKDIPKDNNTDDAEEGFYPAWAEDRSSAVRRIESEGLSEAEIANSVEIIQWEVQQSAPADPDETIAWQDEPEWPDTLDSPPSDSGSWRFGVDGVGSSVYLEFDEDMDDQGDEFDEEDNGAGHGLWAGFARDNTFDVPDRPIVCCVDFSPRV
ncbi:hypothetical protein B0H21DRAFT_543104 [Amylocystis lapponica]|nr:hypothetical protein B0H21DRAFT_543104 [Amylocystis lapponica]